VPRQVRRKQGTRCPLAFREQVQRSERTTVLANGDTSCVRGQAVCARAGLLLGRRRAKRVGGGGRAYGDGVVDAELTFR
jgi:hypothetical protein